MEDVSWIIKMLKMLVIRVSVHFSSPYIFVVATIMWITLVESQHAYVISPSCDELCFVEPITPDYVGADCSGGDIVSIEQIHPCDEVEEINLRDNALRHLKNITPPLGLERVKNLDVSENYIITIDAAAFLSFPNVETISLMAIKIERLVNYTFEGLGMLKKLYFLSGRIQVIEEYAFAGLSNLTILDLRFNKIEFLHPELFRDCPKLESLTLSHNRLTELPGSLFENLSKLRILKLERNSLTRIPTELANIKTLVQVNLKHNQLVEIPHLRVHRLYLSSNHLPRLNIPDPKNVTWQEVHLHDNPLHCDHRLESFRQWYVDNKDKVWGDLYCELPSVVRLDDVDSLSTTPVATTPVTSTTANTKTSKRIDMDIRTNRLDIERGFTIGINGERITLPNKSSHLEWPGVTLLMSIGTAVLFAT